MIDSLHLNVISCSCICGNRWTHSHPWLASQAGGYLGGTPDPDQQHKLRFASFSNQHWQVNGCFRCVPLTLPVQQPERFNEPRANQHLVDKVKAARNELLS